MSKKQTTLPPLDYSNLEQDILSALRSGKSLLGQGGALTPFIKRALEAALEGEMEAHISDGGTAGGENRRNGKSTKTVRGESGS